MHAILLYGLDEAGQAAFTEELPAEDRSRLRALAQDRVRTWPAVEVWDGPMCVVRLRRPATVS